MVVAQFLCDAMLNIASSDFCDGNDRLDSSGSTVRRRLVLTLRPPTDPHILRIVVILAPL
jgi:hypothetical protein